MVSNNKFLKEHCSSCMELKFDGQNRWATKLVAVLLSATLALVVALVTSSAAQQILISPYREQLTSEIRGLTTKEIEDLREGRGMALARAAELNGYPGPRHVLDGVEAGEFHLPPEQLAAVQRLFQEMSTEAQRLGSAILKEEQALEAEFRAHRIDAPNLRERIARIAALQSELRVIHLRTHLETRALLTDHQVEQYNEMRGYAGSRADPDQHNH